jgi:GTP cyclohydrolase I
MGDWHFDTDPIQRGKSMTIDEEMNIWSNLHSFLGYLTRNNCYEPQGQTNTLKGEMRDTPRRVLKAWHDELCSGYDFTEDNIESMLTQFDTPEQYDEIVILKNIEFFSLCSHHLLPFFGTAHIAYLPDKKVVGISKLARLLEVYSRRLQMQERLTSQITTALMKHLNPRGAACVIKAKHLCCSSRGVNKQSSEMVTSSMLGVFRTDSIARNELLRLIGG